MNAQEPAPQSYRTRGSGLWRLLFVGALAAAALLAFLYWSKPQEDPLAAMVTAFQRQNSLTVFRAQVPTFVTDSTSRLFGLLTAEQIAVIPATVEYKLDLSKMTADSFSWDPETQRMAVTLPQITIGTLNLDEGRARYVRKGVLMSGDTQEALTRLNSQSAQADALREARNPELVALARAAARDAMVQNVTVPLRAAGYDDVVVVARFADEPAAGDPSRMDRSRRAEDVLADYKDREKK